jgi:putative Holliday junction resolvase
MAPGSNHDHAPNFMALDVGMARVGVALGSAEARLAHPHGVLNVGEDLFERIQTLCHDEHVGMIVVGLPRGLDGQETSQTIYCREFADQLIERLGSSVQVALQDEALTSRKAVAELDAAKKQYAKGDIDSLSATYILEDYLREHTARGNYEHPH